MWLLLILIAVGVTVSVTRWMLVIKTKEKKVHVWVDHKTSFESKHDVSLSHRVE